MVNQVIGKSQPTGITISGSNGTLTVQKYAWVLGPISEDVSLHDNKITLNGMLSTEVGETSVIAGTNTQFIIGATGGMAGDGFTMSGIDPYLENHGSIYGIGYALDISGAGARVENAGIIQGFYEAVELSHGGSVLNDKSGIISGAGHAVNVAAFSNEQGLIVNHGRIEAVDAVVTGSGNDRLTNDGAIAGNVSMGAGQDVFDGRGGTVDGTINLGADADTYVVSSKLDLAEDIAGGVDTVKSTINYALADNFENLLLLGKANINGTGNALANLLAGNSGNNKLNGGLGADTLHGGKGKDVLTGGADIDMFVFVTGDGKDKVTDFDSTADRLDLAGWKAIANMSDLMHHHVSLVENGVVIEAGADSLTLVGVSKAELQAADIFF